MSTSSVSDMTSGRGEVRELVRDEEAREKKLELFFQSRRSNTPPFYSSSHSGIPLVESHHDHSP